MRRLFLLLTITLIGTISGCAIQNQQLSPSTQNAIQQDSSFQSYVQSIINYLNSHVGKITKFNIFFTKPIDQNDQVSAFNYDLNGHSYDGSALVHKNANGTFNISFSNSKVSIVHKDQFTVYTMSGITENNVNYYLIAGKINNTSINSILIHFVNKEVAEIELNKKQQYYAYVQSGKVSGILNIEGLDNTGKIIASAS